MKKNRIRLTESQLQQVIKESVKRVLKEADMTNDSFDGLYPTEYDGLVRRKLGNGPEYKLYKEILSIMYSYWNEGFAGNFDEIARLAAEGIEEMNGTLVHRQDHIVTV